MKNTKLKKRTKKECTVLTLEGKLSIERVAELKERLLNALAQSEELHLNLSQVTEVDSAFLQLLFSTHLAAARCNKRVRTVDGFPEVLEQAIVRSGFLHQMGKTPVEGRPK